MPNYVHLLEEPEETNNSKSSENATDPNLLEKATIYVTKKA